MSRTWVGFTSVRFANGLIGAIAVAGAFGIVIRQFRAVAFSTPEAYAAELAVNQPRYGEPLSSAFEQLGLYHVFTTWWFSGLVILFSISLGANTVRRLGRTWVDVARPPVKRSRRFFSPGLPGRIEPLEGIAFDTVVRALRNEHYRVRVVDDKGVRHVLAERWRLSPLASPLAHGALLLFVLAMGLITPRFGFEEGLKVPVGAERPVEGPGTPGNLLVRNEEFVARFDERNQPTEFRTRLVVFRDGVEIARKDVQVNEPLSVAGTTFHENFYGPAVEIDVRDASGLILFAGPVILDGNAGGLPEGAQVVPGTDVTLEFLLKRGDGGVAQLDVIGLRPAPGERCYQPDHGVRRSPDHRAGIRPRQRADRDRVRASQQLHRSDREARPGSGSRLARRRAPRGGPDDLAVLPPSTRVGALGGWQAEVGRPRRGAVRADSVRTARLRTAGQRLAESGRTLRSGKSGAGPSDGAAQRRRVAAVLTLRCGRPDRAASAAQRTIAEPPCERPG